jgi:dipeptidyl-peptidase 4
MILSRITPDTHAVHRTITFHQPPPAMTTSMLRCLGALVVPMMMLGTSHSASSQEQKQLTFDQVFKNAEPRVLKNLPMILSWQDDRHYMTTKRVPGEERPRPVVVDAETGTESPCRDLQEFKSLLPPTTDVSAPAGVDRDTTHVIYEIDGDLYLLAARARTWTRLTTTPSEEKNPTLSPDGHHVAFTRDNDLYSIDLSTGKETRYTVDGSEEIKSGWASWVYYEEILGRASRYRAFWWSPDSKRIAFYHFDDTRVPAFPLYNATGQHGTIEHERYPKAGDPNPTVQIGFVTAGNDAVTWASFDGAKDQYFGPPAWTPDCSRLFVQWMNRAQDTLVVYAVDPSTGKPRIVHTEHQSSWVEWYENITFLKDRGGFIIKSDLDGWNHLYYYALDGSLKSRLTSGTWSVKNIAAVDEKRSVVYFTATKEASTRTDLYSVALSGKNLKRLTSGQFTYDVRVSPGGSFFTATYSNVATPSKLALFRNDGSLVRELGDSRTDDFASYRLGKTELFTIATPDGYKLPAVWTLPVDFSPSRRYPVLISIYGGPGSAGVADGWQGISRQWLANEGVIQIAVDHRGSGHFGKNGMAIMHRQLGKWEMEDYGTAARWLRSQPFVDTNAICITGGSYGGYVTLMALTVHPELFTHGIADYAVVDWLLYDSHYTERYMDMPEENADGYRAASVLTYAHNLKGVLRIDHGTLDDNVHMQNAIQLVDSLENMNKHFEFMMYPGGRHGWGGPKSAHLRSETYRFYYQYLLKKEFPEELFGKLDWRSGRRRPGS